MKLIVQNGTDQTAYYWSLARATPDCPNWIARWFLYHKFRYRDGRNRNIKADNRDTTPYKSATTSHYHHDHRHSHHSYHSHHRPTNSHSSYFPNTSMNAGMYFSLHLPQAEIKGWCLCETYARRNSCIKHLLHSSFDTSQGAKPVCWRFF